MLLLAPSTSCHPACRLRLRRPLHLAAVLVLAGSIGPREVAAQPGTPSIVGQVLDSLGAPLAGARVSATEAGRVQVTDARGAFRFTALPAGRHTLAFARLGFIPESRRVVVGDTGVAVQVRMRAARVTLAAVQVTATLSATSAQESPQPTSVLEGPELRVAQGAALGETLEQVPGLRSLSMTTGIGKPVIRGMTHYRVVTLDDGQRTETQAWGHDHSPNVETATAERVEVIKGPASVLYGSDALGGVVNVIAPSVPDALGEPAFVRGRVTTAYSHNVRGADGTLVLEGARGGTGLRAAVTVRGSGDMRTPAAILHNTNNRAVAHEAAAARRGAWGSVSVRYTGRNERIEIFDDPAVSPGYTGYQRIATHRASVEVAKPVAVGQVEARAGFEQNFRREFADASASDADLGLFVRNWTGSLHLHHAPVGFLEGTLGASVMTSDFENRGSQTLIPASGTRNVAVYAVEQADRGRWRVTLGSRYDYRTLTADHAGAEPSLPSRRAFTALTGSLGVLYRISAPVAVVVNVARGFRAPAPPDLFANGFHEGTRAYERGDPDLQVETSLNTEAGLRIARDDLSGEITAFVNDVDGYIYLRPFGAGGGRFDSLEVVQGDARLRGVEARVQFQPVARITLHASGDYVRGDNLAAGVPLTFIPPMRAVYGVRFQPDDGGGPIRGRYLSLTGETNARQTRLDPRDIGPPGYSIASLGAGFSRHVPRGAFTVDLAVRNILDVRYRSFMSRYKAFADGPGRSASLKVSTPF